ncbi:MAG: HlyD family efflux transporter periplasmic adaptor subunit [Eubacteriales bacterium]|nr:HlyD family efflux transporter periplasmic adaptor subunit [Eubacteriales bacterium]
MTTTAKPKKKKKLKKLIAWVIVLALLGGALYLFVWPEMVSGATTTYDSYTATRGTLSNSLSFSGSVSVLNSETLSADAECTVRRIYVTEQQAVKTGDKLMRLSTGETLKASFDGEVNELSVEESDTVSAGDSLIQIVDFNNLQVSMRVDEYDISSVSVGLTCSVTVTALGQTFDSTVSHINRISASQGSTAYYTVSAEMSAGSSGVLPGMAVTVTIPQEEAVDAVLLNADAVSFDRTNSAYVLMKNDAGEMEQVAVEVGVGNDRFIEITSGVNEGDTVYVEVKNSAASSGGLASLFSSLSGGTQTQTQTQQSGGFPGGNMPDMSNMGSGNRGNFSGGGGFPGGM